MPGRKIVYATGATAGALRWRVLNLTFGSAVLVLATVYGLTAIAVAVAYRLCPSSSWKSLDNESHPTDGANHSPTMAECLQYSCSIQLTSALSNMQPIGIAAVLTGAHAFGALVYLGASGSFLVMLVAKRRPSIRFAEMVCYDPRRHSFVLRFQNADRDSLTEVDIRVGIGGRTFDQDPAIARDWWPIAGDWNRGTATPGLIWAIRTRSNRGRPGRLRSSLVRESIGKNIASPLSLEPDDHLTLAVSGTSSLTGERHSARTEYGLSQVKCGVFRETTMPQDRVWSTWHFYRPKYRMHDFDAWVPTDTHVCRSCPFIIKCPLDVAQRVRVVT